MIVSVKPSRLSSRRRAAFTLVEVLVVVAIVVILASVGTIATLAFLDGANEDAARMKAQNLHKIASTWTVEDIKNGGTGEVTDLLPIAEKSSDGLRALETPWRGQYQFQYVQDPASNGQSKLFIYAMKDMGNGQSKALGWPREFEPLVNGQ